MTVKDFIILKTNLHSSMRYDESRMCFLMEPYRSTETGIYFIVDDNDKFDILKVGKAEGKYGLSGRLGSYRSSQVTRYPNDRTTQLLYKTMTNTHKDKWLSMYVFEIPMSDVLFEGYVVKASLARSFEELLSKQARAEGHTMVLSGQD